MREKTDILILRVIINNLCNLSNEKSQYSFILSYRRVGEQVSEKVLNK